MDRPGFESSLSILERLGILIIHTLSPPLPEQTKAERAIFQFNDEYQMSYDPESTTPF